MHLIKKFNELSVMLVGCTKLKQVTVIAKWYFMLLNYGEKNISNNLHQNRGVFSIFV
jgi:hypothetical protein